MKGSNSLILLFIAFIFFACSNKENSKMKFVGKPHEVKLMTLDPGHFHAALVQKTQYDQVSPTVFIYAPNGGDVTDHLKRIDSYNHRKENSTNWESVVYLGDDFYERMLNEKPGNVLIISGNNKKKTEYIKSAVDASINLLADKPMCIDKDGFILLLKAFDSAQKNNVLLYDIMTERSEITTILQKKLIEMPDVFGELVEGTIEDPAIVKQSVHHFYKYVSGNPLKRPVWFFDASQQGDGLVDVTTHLVDLIQWELFPAQILDYKNDVEIIEAKHWPTILTLEQFSSVTQVNEFPDFLKTKIEDESLPVYSNGEINYKLKGINSKVIVEWKYKAPEGGSDTHYSIIRGTKSNIIIKQGKDQNYKPELYIQGVEPFNHVELNKIIISEIEILSEKYPGVYLEKEKDYWHVNIPDKYRIGHEAHFSQVMERYLGYLVDGKLPEWEIPNMITKYYTTTHALELAQAK